MKSFIKKMMKMEEEIYQNDKWYYDPIFQGILEEVKSNIHVLDIAGKSSVDIKRDFTVLFCFFAKKYIPLLSNKDYSILQYLFDKYITIK